jgi:hypothetical protein
MTAIRINDFIGAEFQNELASKTVGTHQVKLMMITNPTLNRIEYAVFMNGGSTVFTRDFKQAIADYNEITA